MWAAHLERLARGCTALGLPLPDAAAVAKDAAAAVAALGAPRTAVRITWTAGSGGRGLVRPDPLEPRLIVSAAAAPPLQTPAAMIISNVRRNAGSPASRLKTLSYLDNVLARRQALAVGVDEALMLNGEGRLACASAANLFWIGQGRLFTPALHCGVLDGIMRGQVIEAAAAMGVVVEEVAAGAAALAGAEALFITNSLIGLRGVRELDGRAYGEHSLVEALRTALAELT
jgi:branched-chain amino acid aminotransferase/4-amino-4-deoxychorismate lyase